MKKWNIRKIKLKKIITFLLKKINFCSFETFEIIKNKISLIYKFYAFIFIFFYIKQFISEIDDKIIIVKNVRGEPNTFAEVVIQNQIDYIPKVSVIIPVYNTNEFLNKCLETVINQTLEEIEIICVDDGSTDNSLEILKYYANKDKRITILKQKNLHAGVARNAGLTIAKGEYLSFLDSDDFFDLNMLKEMYEKIRKEKSDIIICQSKYIDFETGLFEEKTFINSLRFDLIPKKNSFSPLEISNNIFQIFEGWAWDKLFKTDFILLNNIKFLNIINYNDNQFTYTALCMAKSITTLKKIFVIKRHGHKKSLSANRNKAPNLFLSSFNKIKSNLKKFHLYHLYKKSFYKWVIQLCLAQLKRLNIDSKEYLFNILHKKFNSLDYINDFSPSSNRYIALHYIKYQKIFPTINIVFLIDKKNFKLCLISIVSILKNSEYENINFILLYNDIGFINFHEVNKLKKIRYFDFQTLYIPNIHYKYFPTKKGERKTISFSINLMNYFLYYLSNINKVLYLSCNTIVRKSLLFLWEIDLKNKLIGAVGNFSFNKENVNKINLKNHLYIYDSIYLLNIEELKKVKFNEKILNYYKNLNQINKKNQDKFINFSGSENIKLNIEYNYMEILNKIIQSDNTHLTLNKSIINKIIHFSRINLSKNIHRNLFSKKIKKYNSILNKIKNETLTIPIVLSTDDKYTPFLYTTMISILENGYKNTYYIFYLLVPFNFSKINENKIYDINNKYKCYIYFIHIQNIFENIVMRIPHITSATFFRLLIGDYLPKRIKKCIYLDIDMCVLKDLSELFLIEMKDNYIAGVVAAGYYFNEKKNCKRLNLPSMKQYVNAGMLVMNLKQIRRDNMTQKFIKLLKRNYSSQDQDVLNVACYGKIITLPPKYNAMIGRLKENSPILRDIYTEEEIIEAKDSPYIIHYSNKNKPWNSIGIFMEKYWWDNAKKTPFIDNLFTRENIYKEELKKFYYKKTKKLLNFDKPTSFNEKIQWLKVYESTPIKTQLSDKYLVRGWVKEKIGEKYLIPLLGIYNKFEDINFEKLPNQFVIKCNHGKGYIIIVKNKYQLNLNEAKKKIEKWMNINYAYQSSIELQYRDIKHKIIIEKYIDDNNLHLKDYKISCFSGRPNFIWIDSEKNSVKRRNLYDLNWNQLPYKVNPTYSTFPSPKKPKYLKKILRLASILSNNFAYVRVDFYIIHDKIYFDEMTFTSFNGNENILPYSFDLKLASLIHFPKFVYNIDSGKYYELRKYPSLYDFLIILIFLNLKLFYNLKKFFEINFS